MIVRLIASFIFFWIVFLCYFFINLWVLMGTLIWNYRIWRQFWPKWGFDQFCEDIIEVVEGPWKS